jgi:hypothetical protein
MFRSIVFDSELNLFNQFQSNVDHVAYDQIDLIDTVM